METKHRACRQCGELKPVNGDNFRPYYGNRKGFYRTCLTCEKINNRHKYLSRKKELTSQEEQDLDKIEALYDILRQRGLKPPASRNTDAVVMGAVDDLLSKHTGIIEEIKASNPELPTDTPVELLEWLEKDLTGMDPEVLQEDIIDRLYSKYRPQTGVDSEYKPVYDDTYRDVLLKIQKKFDEYEDSFE